MNPFNFPNKKGKKKMREYVKKEKKNKGVCTQ